MITKLEHPKRKAEIEKLISEAFMKFPEAIELLKLRNMLLAIIPEKD